MISKLKLTAKPIIVTAEELLASKPSEILERPALKVKAEFECSQQFLSEFVALAQKYGANPKEPKKE